MKRLGGIDEIWKRLQKKGGHIHMSLRDGVIAYINGQKPIVLVKPCKDWDTNKHGTGPISDDILK